MHQISRRELLAGAGAATASLAGCVGGGSSDESLTVETLAVGELSGGDMAVNPPETATLIDFFATWCAPCKPQMAELREIRERYPDLHMLSVSWEQDKAAIKDFWREYEGTWPVGQDTELNVADAYNIDGRLPTKIVIGADGSEVWRNTGLSSAEKIAEHVETAQE